MPEQSCWICYTTEPFSPFSPRSEAQPCILSPFLRQWSLLRIAMSGRNAVSSEWVHPCSCKGSTQWVHQSCLLAWIRVSSANLDSTSDDDDDGSDRESPLAASLQNPPLNQPHSAPQQSSESHRSLSSRWQSSYTMAPGQRMLYRDARICCPQCRTPYHISQRVPGRWATILKRLTKLGRLIQGYALLGLFSASLYATCYIYGLASLFALHGREDTLRLLLDLSPDVSLDIVTAPDVDFPLSLRSQLLIVAGVPLLPVALLLAALPALSRRSSLYLYAAAYAYGTPRHRLLIWLVPIVWLAYKDVREYFFRYLAIGRYAPSYRATHGPYTNAGDEGREDLAFINTHGTDSRSESMPSIQLPHFAANPPTATTTTTIVLEVILSKVAQVLWLPFLAYGTGFGLLALFRLEGLPYASPGTPFPIGPALSLLSTLGYVLPPILRSSLSFLYTRTATWLHGLTPFCRNLVAASLLIIIKDAILVSRDIEEEKLVQSRIVLDYVETDASLSDSQH